MKKHGTPTPADGLLITRHPCVGIGVLRFLIFSFDPSRWESCWVDMTIKISEGDAIVGSKLSQLSDLCNFLLPKTVFSLGSVKGISVSMCTGGWRGRVWWWRAETLVWALALCGFGQVTSPLCISALHLQCGTLTVHVPVDIRAI